VPYRAEGGGPSHAGAVQWGRATRSFARVERFGPRLEFAERCGTARLQRLLNSESVWCDVVDRAEAGCARVKPGCQCRRRAWIRGTPKGRKATMAAASARKAPHDQLKPDGLRRKASATRTRLIPVRRARS
jgi:hypothetical protein